MASSPRNKLFMLALAAPLALVGCGPEYGNNRDRIYSGSGNAHEANTAIQEVTPRYVNQTRIGSGG